MPAASSQLNRRRSATVAIAAGCVPSMARASNSAVNRAPASAQGTESCLSATMGRARQPRDAGVDQRPVLTGVQVAPLALAMVVDRRGGVALRTHPQRLRGQRPQTWT